VDYVNFAPGEPNGGRGESAVTLDMRGKQGIVTNAGQARHGASHLNRESHTVVLLVGTL
jgi:hypothetical protein